jgi:hypothetical protein
VDCVTSRLVLWIALALAAVPLGIAIYVALFEQGSFNWPVVGVFSATGIDLRLVGWMISYNVSRRCFGGS